MKSLKIFLIATYLTAFTCTAFCQKKLSDSKLNSMSRIELADYYQKKSDGQTGGGCALFLVGSGITVVAFTVKNDEWYDLPKVFLLPLAGFTTMAMGGGLLISGSKYKGRAEMLYLNPDPEKAAALVNEYNRKARKNSIIGFSLLGIGIIVPSILLHTADDYEGMGQTAQTVSNITMACAVISIPFLMEAAKNKGRISILTKTDHISASFLQNSGTHRSIGIGIPIGK
jgi:hypothetical protein